MFRTIRRSVVALASAALLAATAVVNAPVASADVDVYSTPGYHNINGREWFTKCEPYSQTTRCRTEIKATVVGYDSAKKQYFQRYGWAFNNLTYLESDWAMWKGNPLAAPGGWTAPDGRNWSTECNTAQTGRNGCRSYAQVYVTSYNRATNQYSVNHQWVFNNITRFTPGTMPADLGSDVTMPDAALRACISEELGGAPITSTSLGGLRFLQCTAADLTGLEHAVNLSNVWLSGTYTDLTPIAKLPKLEQLHLLGTKVSNLAPLASAPVLRDVSLRNTAVTDFSPLAGVRTLERIHLTSPTLTSLGSKLGGPNVTVVEVEESPRLTDVSALSSMTGLTTIHLQGTGALNLPSLKALTALDELDMAGSKVTSLAALAGHPSLREINIDATPVTDVAPLATMPKLAVIMAHDTAVTNWTVLKPKFDAGGLQIFWKAPSDGYDPPW